MLEFLDGMEPTNGYALLGTTNELYELDPALLRPGRFDVHRMVGKPDSAIRRRVLEAALAHSEKKVVPGLDQAVELTAGFSYAELAELARRYKIAVVRKTASIAVDQALFDATTQAMAAERSDTRPRLDG
jgi:ATP-dependent 26S proteasome regulatory subunit